MTQLDGAMGEPIPLACVNWANTKAAYRFLSNEDVSEGEILAGHFASTGDRIRAAGGPRARLRNCLNWALCRRTSLA